MNSHKALPPLNITTLRTFLGINDLMGSKHTYTLARELAHSNITHVFYLVSNMGLAQKY